MKQLQTIGASAKPKPAKSSGKNPFSFDPFEALDILEKPLGSVKNIASNLAEPIGESAKIVGGDILGQFGFERKSDASPFSGDIPEGEGVDIKALVAKRKEEEEKAKEEAKAKSRIEGGIDYFG